MVPSSACGSVKKSDGQAADADDISTCPEVLAGRLVTIRERPAPGLGPGEPSEVHVPYFTFSRFQPHRSKANRLEIETQRNETGNLLVEQATKQIGVTPAKTQ